MMGMPLDAGYLLPANEDCDRIDTDEMRNTEVGFYDGCGSVRR